MRKQVVFEAQNGMKLVIDKNSDPRNVKLFNDVVVRQIKEGCQVESTAGTTTPGDACTCGIPGRC